MKIVVTGALGHIGSRLIREIASKYDGAEVILLDNLSTQRFVSLFNLPKTAKYQFHEIDISQNSYDLSTFITGSDVVIHLAAITNAEASLEWKSHMQNMNFAATRNVADTCAHLKIPMIYISTTSVYGTQSEQVDEQCSDEELQPQSPYAESKLKEEAYLRELGRSRQLQFITCRFGTIFGVSPGMRFHTAVNKFCWQASIGQPLSVWETALHQQRPYLDLTDAIAAVFFICDRNLFDRQIYNVLTLNSSVADIIESIRPHVSDLKVEFVHSKIMNQLSYRVSNEKFRSKGFKFEGDLQKGIVDTIQLLKNL